MNPQLALVPFESRHAPGVVEVIRSVFVEYRMTFDLSGYDADLRDIPASYLARGGTFAVLVDGTRVMGTVAVLPRDAAECEIKRLYLRPEVRGQGHGRRLLEHALDWARAAGYRRAIAWSDARLGTAHEVYRRMRFASIGERVTDDIDRSQEYGFALDLAL